MKKKKLIVVNLAGGPGAGKSILASDVFSALKRKFVTCELSSEYIKRKIREKAHKAIQNQLYIFAKQQFQLFSLKDEVTVVVTDCPLFLSSFYDDSKCDALRELVMKEFNRYDNLTFLIKRNKDVPFETEGRIHDSKQAKTIDRRMKKFMNDNGIGYKELEGIGQTSIDAVVETVIKKLK